MGKRITGCSGEIFVTKQSSDRKLKLALIPQLDLFFERLTVRESLQLASRLKNSSHPDAKSLGNRYHSRVVTEIMTKLDLKSAADINVYEASGSQRKRLSIGLDLVSRPKILMLDEPTTGLDSFAAKTVVELLHDLAVNDGLAVLMTIHQPSWTLFSLFSKIYMLSPVIGNCIFEGPPEDVKFHLENVGYFCPPNTSAPDFLTDVAFGEHGSDGLKILGEMQHMLFSNKTTSENSIMYQLDNDAGDDGLRVVRGIHDSTSGKKSMVKNVHLSDATSSRPSFSLKHILVLCERRTKMILRDPILLWTQVVTSVIAALIIYGIFGTQSNRNGCPPDVSNKKINGGIVMWMAQEIRKEITEVSYNKGVIFCSFLVTSFFSMVPALFSRASENRIIWKEIKNKWYSSHSYLVTSIVIDTIAGCLINSFFGVICYCLQEFPFEDGGWRFFFFISNMCIMTIVGQSIATIVACICSESVQSSIFIGLFSLIPQILLTGFFITWSHMAAFPTAISNFCFQRWTFDLGLLSIYGFDRCGMHVTEKVFGGKRSIENWLLEMMEVTIDDGKTVFDDENIRNDYGHLVLRGYAAIQTFAESVTNDLYKWFVSKDGSVRSAALNMNQELIDSDVGRALAFSFLLIFIFRSFAYLIVFREINAHF